MRSFLNKITCEHLSDCAAFAQSPVAMAYLDPATAEILAVNAGALKTLNRELRGQNPLKLGWIKPAQWHRLIKKLQAGHAFERQEFNLTDAGGRLRPGLLSAALVQEYGHRFVWLSFLDQADLQTAVQRLASLEPLARHFFYESPDALSLTDLNGRILEINPAAAAILKRQPQELSGQFVWHRSPDPNFAQTQASLYQRIAAQATTVAYEEHPQETMNGGYFHVIAQPVKDGQGRVVAIKKLRRDISERVACETVDRQRNRLEAIGTLAAGIAHDFNNILGGVILNSELALLEQGLEADTRGLLESILAAGKRGRDLVSQIQTFSRQDTGTKTELDLVALINENLRFLRATTPAGIALSFECAAASAKIRASGAHISQLILNLVTNAARAVAPESGNIRLKLGPIEVKQREAGRLALKPGTYWELSVTDDGCGMPPAVAARAIEPFFTTQADTSGMGLAVVHGIVQDLGGELQITSRPQQGSRIRILLPVFEAQPPSAQSAAPASPLRVMLVEDDQVIRTATSKMLAKLDCAVTSCPEAGQALDLLVAEPHSWDLLITDLSLPGLQGLDLARQIHRLRADLPIILSSGYHDQLTSEHLSEAGIALVLEKPFTRSELAHCLEQALRTGARG